MAPVVPTTNNCTSKVSAFSKKHVSICTHHGMQFGSRFQLLWPRFCACSELISIADTLFCTLCYICNSELLVSYFVHETKPTAPPSTIHKKMALDGTANPQDGRGVVPTGSPEPLGISQTMPVSLEHTGPSLWGKAHACPAWRRFSLTARTMPVLCAHADQAQTRPQHPCPGVQAYCNTRQSNVKSSHFSRCG